MGLEVNYDQKSLTLNKFCGLGALKPLEKQNKDLLPVLGDGISAYKHTEPNEERRNVSNLLFLCPHN